MSQAVPDRKPDTRARLVRNLLALRMVLSVEQMQTGRGAERIAELDEALGRLGHDMKSIANRAADGLRRSFLLPRLLQRGRTRHPARDRQKS